MSFEAHAADRLMMSCAELAREWLSLLEEQAAPTGRWYESHAPELLRISAHFILERSIDVTQSPVASRVLHQFGAMHRESGGTPAQLAHDFSTLARVLERACVNWVGSYDGNASAAEVAAVTARVGRSPLQLCSAALAAYDEQDGHDSDARLMYFADAVAHELNTPLNAASVTAQLLEYAEGDMRSAEARRLAVLIRRNLQQADDVLQNLRHTVLSRKSAVSAGNGIPHV